jgi:hypothetical protein
MTIRQPRDELLGIEEILRQLRDGPPQIEAMTAGLSPAALRTRPMPDEWSITKLSGHEAVHVPQIESVVRALKA